MGRLAEEHSVNRHQVTPEGWVRQSRPPLERDDRPFDLLGQFQPHHPARNRVRPSSVLLEDRADGGPATACTWNELPVSCA